MLSNIVRLIDKNTNVWELITESYLFKKNIKECCVLKIQKSDIQILDEKCPRKNLNKIFAFL